MSRVNPKQAIGYEDRNFIIMFSIFYNCMEFLIVPIHVCRSTVFLLVRKLYCPVDLTFALFGTHHLTFRTTSIVQKIVALMHESSSLKRSAIKSLQTILQIMSALVKRAHLVCNVYTQTYLPRADNLINVLGCAQILRYECIVVKVRRCCKKSFIRIS